VAAVFLGKVLGGALFGLLMTAAVALGSILSLGVSVNVGHLVLVLIPALLAFSSLGALLCVLVREVFEAQTLLNLPRFLMIFLSGVVYPVAAMPRALQVLARVLPLTYAVDGLRGAFWGPGAAAYVDALVLLGFALAFVVPGMRLLARRFE
ncbi:MAG TPA: ABC transporter permease, partial [Candidatus Bipolaricaulis anaerobius]|nr:ABC transporter permease [Candidatus Bipolaricaulis anaerobius]